ncbi:hypothetical protein ACFSLT_07290 [Novosphingobium resinovorum]
MLEAIRAHHAADRPILAECGGMLYACASLTDVEGIGPICSDCWRGTPRCSGVSPPSACSTSRCREGPCAGTRFIIRGWKPGSSRRLAPARRTGGTGKRSIASARSRRATCMATSRPLPKRRRGFSFRLRPATDLR